MRFIKKNSSYSDRRLNSIISFNKMLLSNAEFLRPFAITLTRDSESAKDLFQETVYRALANREKYNVGTNIKAWLYTIMRNIFINNYRRKSKQNTVFDSTPNDFLLDFRQTPEIEIIPNKRMARTCFVSADESLFAIARFSILVHIDTVTSWTFHWFQYHFGLL